MQEELILLVPSTHFSNLETEFPHSTKGQAREENMQNNSISKAPALLGVSLASGFFELLVCALLPSSSYLSPLAFSQPCAVMTIAMFFPQCLLSVSCLSQWDLSGFLIHRAEMDV